MVTSLLFQPAPFAAGDWVGLAVGATVSGGNATSALSLAVTVVLLYVPVTVAMFVKLLVTFANEQEYVLLAPIPRLPIFLLQFGAIGSLTETPLNATLPVLVTTIWKLAVWP